MYNFFYINGVDHSIVFMFAPSCRFYQSKMLNIFLPKTLNILSLVLLSTKPFLVCVFDGRKYGLLKRSVASGVSRYNCTICSPSQMKCAHIECFKEWAACHSFPERDQDIVDHASKFTSMSYKKIPYPLPTELCALYNAYETFQKALPEALVPNHILDQRCIHGKPFSGEDPVSSEWVASSDVFVHKYSVTIVSTTRNIYYRPAVGCEHKCKSYYDGQEHLLFNLDNKHLFYYGMLFQYLHLMIEGKNPLAAFHRSATRCHAILGSGATLGPPSLKILRSAWNAFIRLLDLDFVENFQCQICGSEPDIKICDGTLLGFRKDLLPALLQQSTMESLPITHGSKHRDRTFIRSVRGRELLLKYSGYTKDRRRLPIPISQ